MGHARDGSRQAIGRRDRDPLWADAAQRLDELLQPRALIEGQRCSGIEIPGRSQRCSGRYRAHQELPSRDSCVVCPARSPLVLWNVLPGSLRPLLRALLETTSAVLDHRTPILGRLKNVQLVKLSPHPPKEKQYPSRHTSSCS